MNWLHVSISAFPDNQTDHLEPSAQDRPGAVGAGPEEAPAMI